MPCYLFTYHAYGSWMPDRNRGYVRRKQGVLAADTHMATCYRRNLRHGEIEFSSQLQQAIILAVVDGCGFLSARCHAIATDPTHIHCLISWQHDRAWQRISESIKRRITQDLTTVEKRKWLSKGSSRKRVKDRAHFQYLVESYLPRHQGAKWFEGALGPGES